MRSLRRTGLIALILAVWLVAALPAEAKGPPDMITITGPGIDGELRITDPGELAPFSFYQFNDLGRRTKAPDADLGSAYHITRYVNDSGAGKNSLKAWDSLTYYLNPDGGLGYLFFDGLDPAIGSTEGQGEWYLPSEEGDAMMKHLLVQSGALHPAGAGAGGAPSAEPRPLASPRLWPVAAAAGTMAVLVAAWLQARRRVLKPEP